MTFPAPAEEPVPSETILFLSASARTKLFIAELFRSRSFIVGCAVSLFWILDAILWPWLTPYDPQTLNADATLQAPSARYWFGTDDFGRDVLSRLMAGASTILTIAPIATLLGVLGGVVLGSLAAYYRGPVDAAITRLIEAMLAFPLIIVAVAVLGLLGGSSINVILIVAIQFTPMIARTVRGAVLVECGKDYVAAARMLGDSGLVIVVREILPNILPVILVEATARLGYAVFASATLSFLTLGVQQPSPDWGLSIALGRSYLQVAPWIVLYPAAALATIVIAVNLISDATKEALDR